MPLPVIAAAAVVALTALARFVIGSLLVGAAGEYARRKVQPYIDEFEGDLLAVAVKQIGLELSPDGHLTDESITASINTKLLGGTGVQIDSLLDRDKLRAGLERLAIKKLAEAVGVPLDDSQTMAGVKTALQAWAAAQVVAQMQDEEGAVFDAAVPSKFIQKVITDAVKNEGWNTPTDLTAKGVANRARQEKYRHQHKRTWVEKT